MVLYNRLSNGRMSIGVKGRYGGKVLGMFTTGLIIKEKAWDEKERFIKDSYEKDFQHEYNRLLEIKDKVRDARNKLAKGDLFWNNVEDYVMRRPVEYVDQSVLEYTKTIEPTINRQYSTINKHIQMVSALENKILPKEYKPLMFSHLNDMGVVRQINDLVISRNISASYKRQILLAIQLIWRKKNGYDKDAKLFSKIPSENRNPIPKTPVTHNQIMEGLTKINSIKQLEAILFWLYSMSLLGLDGVDLVNLDDDCIVGNKKNMKMPYHPQYDRPEIGLGFGQKSHIQVIRTKSRVRDNKDYITITRLGNLFPTFYIRRLLKRCIAITKPQHAYTGKDSLRLFNFKTMDKNRKQIPEGVKKWKIIRYQYSNILKEKLGATVQFTRATSSDIARQLDISDQSIDTFLGHANNESKGLSRALKHYLPDNQLKIDTDHIFMLIEFGMNQKINDLIDMHKDKYELIDNKEVKWFSDWLLPNGLDKVSQEEITRDTIQYLKWDTRTYNTIAEFKAEQGKDFDRFEAITLIKSFWNFFALPLSDWSKAEELEFQKWQKKYSEVQKIWSPEEGKLVDKVIKPEDYDDRFKDLIRRKYGKQEDELDSALEMYDKELEKAIETHNKLVRLKEQYVKDKIKPKAKVKA